MLITCGIQPIRAELLRIQVGPVSKPQPIQYQLGTTTNTRGDRITVDNLSLFLNGRRWFPVMGEFHYARYPSNEWRTELLKMKAGGIDIVATYVFWIHHEEIEGQWDWSGSRDLRSFVKLCGELGLKTMVRCGPWCHGEVRNGGFPDWLLRKGWRLRSDDTNYLAKVRILYAQIAQQLDGLLWKDGGPVIGIQLENEYRGGGGHLLTLKRIAREVGLDVPLYTRTGWPALARPVPPGEIFPMYGVYAEGFWDRELTPMPGRYWAGFHFSKLKTDDNIANEMLGRRQTVEEPEADLYPFLTCEIGGGMMNSYHRRIRIDPEDIEAITLVKLGSGSSLLGYYMYHGGVNPEGKLTTLMESQMNGEWNDLPVKNYDFQAPLGQYGQVRPHYHLLRRLHLFLHDWGELLAGMPSWLPEVRPTGRTDTNTLRWAVRSDGNAGFIFVNNHQRLEHLPAKSNIQFLIQLPHAQLAIPDRPVDVPAGARFFWPFRMPLAPNTRLIWATAQPICKSEGKTTTIFFRAVDGIQPRFAIELDRKQVRVTPNAAYIEPGSNPFQTIVAVTNPGPWTTFEIRPRTSETIRIVVLTDTQSLRLWKLAINDTPVVIYSPAELWIDAGQIHLRSTNLQDLVLGIQPPITLRAPGMPLRRARLLCHPAPHTQTVFDWWVFDYRDFPTPDLKCSIEPVKPPGETPEVKLGPISRPVATQPQDADFHAAGIWRIKCSRPGLTAPVTDLILAIEYIADVARVLHNGSLIMDDFYNGTPLELALGRHAEPQHNTQFDLQLLPLRNDAPIFIDPRTKPRSGPNLSQICELKSVRLIPVYSVLAKPAHPN